MKMERYSRQTMLPEIGEEGQRRLQVSSALIVGLGGLGAPVAIYLTAAGVGCIGLADNDRVSLTNLQRQVLYDEDCLGALKTESAELRLKKMSSSTMFRIHGDRLTAENVSEIIGHYDIVVDCTDNYRTRLLIDDECHKAGKPWIHGAIEGFRGVVTVFNYIKKRRYSELFPDISELDDNGTVTGTFGVLPGVVGCLQATEALKILGGFGEPLDGKLLTIDILTNFYNVIEF